MSVTKESRTWCAITLVKFKRKIKQYKLQAIIFLYYMIPLPDRRKSIGTRWRLQWGHGLKEIWDLAKLYILGKSGWNFRIFEVLTPENVRNRLESIRHELQKWTNQIHIFSTKKIEIGSVFFFRARESWWNFEKSENPRIFVIKIQGFGSKTVPIYRFSDKVEKVFLM